MTAFTWAVRAGFIRYGLEAMGLVSGETLTSKEKSRAMAKKIRLGGGEVSSVLGQDGA